MSALRRWLEGRAPAPPSELTHELDVPAIEVGVPPDIAAALTTAGLSRMDLARDRPGRVRASAFHLLAADALVTYACEAALEHDDADASLEAVLQAVGRR